MKILGIIPARGGSKGVPNKNIKQLNGKPLIAYTAEVALKSRFLSKVIVSTDDEKIAEVARSLGLEVPFMRPSTLARDASPTLPVVKHALEFFKDKGESFDAVCLLQVTSPMRTFDLLEQCLLKFISNKQDSLISVIKVEDHFNPHWMFKENEEGGLSVATGEKQIIPRRQELPDAFYRDGSVYITKADVIVNQGSLYGSSVGFVVNEVKTNVNIDTLEDWKSAEIIFKSEG
jgi:CMP-N,N'-diacetyllegionaminic acid synthase